MKFRVCPRCKKRYWFKRDHCPRTKTGDDGCGFGEFYGGYQFWIGYVYIEVNTWNGTTRITYRTDLNKPVKLELRVMLPRNLTQEQLDKYLLLL